MDQQQPTPWTAPGSASTADTLALRAPGAPLYDLLDKPRLRQMLASFCELVGVSAALVDLHDNVLLEVNTQPICADFFRVNPLTRTPCVRQRDVQFQVVAGQHYMQYHCSNGLTNLVVPITLNGVHLANLYVGQFLTEPTDVAVLHARAREAGFATPEFLTVLETVTVIPATKLPAIVQFLTSTTELVTQMAQERLELLREREHAEMHAREAEHAREESEQVHVALREAETHLRLLTENVPVVLYAFDTHGYFTLSDGIGLEPLGLLPGEAVGLSVYDLYRDYPVITDAVRQALAGQPSQFLVHLAGHWFDSWLLPVFDTGGAVTGALGLSFDITERMAAEDALREASRLNEQIIEGVQEGIIVYDVGLRYRAWNPYMERLTGKSAAEVLGRHPHEVFPFLQDAGMIERLEEALAGEVLPAADFPYTVPETRHRGWASDISSPLRNSDGEIIGVIGIVRDITWRRRREDAQRLKLELWAYAEEHTLDELIQYTLDRAEQMTGSNIGFFHFLEADQTTLTLQTWSTNTLATMCTAQGKGEHYSVDQAGVWVDCVREGRPVIHNDYASLPHRRGMPVGHAPVTREMSIPITRSERIVAIIGVGNKPDDYSDDDVRAVNELADMAIEIVSRKRAEEALVESNRLLRAAQEIAQLGTWEMDHLTGRLTWSDETYQIFGITPHQFHASYDDFIAAVHPEDRDGVQHDFLASVAGGYPYELEHHIIRRDTGEVRILHEKAEHLADADGKIFRTVGMVQDITARKAVEDALRESEERFFHAFEFAGIGMAMVRMDGQFLKANQALCDMLGYSESELCALTFNDVTYPDDIAIGNDLVARLHAGEMRRFSLEKRYVHQLGHLVWIKLDVSIVRAQDGTPLYKIAQMDDITERKLAEDALRESEERMRFALDASQMGSWAINLTNMAAFRSLQHDRIFGYETLQPRWTYDIFLEHVDAEDRARVDAAFQHAVQTQGTWQCECRIHRADGTHRWIWVAGRHRKVPALQTPIMAGIIQDITERKEAEEAVRRSEALLKSTEQISHVGGWQWSIDQQTMSWTDETYRIHDMDPDDVILVSQELIAKSLACYAPADQQRVIDAFNLCCSKGTPYDIECSFTTVTGRERWVRTVGEAITHENRIVAVVGNLIDITEKKQADEALRHSEELLNTIQDISHVGGWELDLIAHTSTWTDEVYRIHGLQPNSSTVHSDELIERSLACYRPEDRELVMQTFRCCIEEGEPYELEMPFTTFDGRERWVRTMGEAVRDNDQIVKVVGYIADITERKVAEAQLIESRRHATDIIHGIPSGLFIYQYEAPDRLVLVEGNPAAWQIMAIPPDAAIGQAFMDIWHGDTADQVYQDYLTVMHTGISYETEDLYYTDDHISAAFHIHAFPLPGHRLGVAFEDITARKLAEHAVLESEARWREYIEHAPFAIYLVDETARILQVNPEAIRATGYIEAELLEFRVPDLLPPASYPIGKATFLAASATGFAQGECYYRRQDGTLRWTDVSVVKLSETRYLAFANDIHERKLAEDAVRESEERWREYIEHAPYGIFLADDAGRYLQVNPQACQLTGYTEAELLAMRISDLVAPECMDMGLAHFMRVQQDGYSQGEACLRLKNGEIRWVDVSAVRLSNALTLAFVQDIHERKLAEAQLLRTTALLDSVRQAQSLYISQSDSQTVFQSLLETLVTLTGSEFGFLDEVLHDADGTPYKLSLALSNIAWDDDSQALYQELKARNLEFRNLANLSGLPLVIDQPIIANDAPHDSRSGGLPTGHPPIQQYMGLPVRSGETVIGVVGVANRPGGYDDAMATFLEPYLVACAGIIEAMRLRTREQEAVSALTMSEERYRLLVETAAEGIWTMDADHITTYVNQAMADMLGYAVDEILGQPVEAFFYESDAAFHAERMRQRHAKKDETYERRFRRKDGTELWTLVAAKALTDAQGQFSGSFAMFTDITERKEAEDALRASEDNLRSLFNAIHESVCLFDSDGTIIAANITFAERIQRCVNELKGLNIFTLLSSNVAEARRRYVDQLLQTRQAVQFEDERSGRWMHHSMFPILDAQGVVVRVAVFAADVTERKLGEAALRESEARWQFALEGAGDGVWDWDAVTNQVYFSPQWKAMLGYAVDEIGTALDEWESRVHPDDLTIVHAELARFMAQPDSLYMNEHRMRCKDGSYRWILDRGKTIALTPDGRPARVIGTHTDITERKQAEEALRTSEAQLSDALRMARAGYWEYDVARDLFTFNDNFYRIFGTTAEAVGGYTLSSADYAQRFCHPDDRHQVAEETLAAIQTDDPHFSRQIEHRFLHADGEVGYLIVRFFVMKDAQGRTVKTFGVNQDITERKRAEAAIQTSEERLRQTLDQMPFPVNVMSPDGTSVFANQAALDVLRLSSSDSFVGRYNVFADQFLYKAGLQDEVTRAFRGEVVFLPEVNFRQVLGAHPTISRAAGYDVVDVTLFPVFQSSGQVERVVSIWQDVTERTRAEDALRQSEAKFRLVAETANCFMYIHDGRYFLFANRFMQDMLEYSEDELLTMPIQQVIHPDHWAEVRDTIDRRFQRHEISHRLEIQVVAKSGRVLWVEISSDYIDDYLGQPAIIGVALDITERKRAEETLREREETYRALVEGIPDIVMRFDRAGRHLFVSGNVEAQTGISAAHFLGKTHQELGFAAEMTRFWEDGIHRVFASGRPYETEFSLPMEQGTQYYDWRIVPEFDAEGQVQTVLTIARNITAHHEAERNYQTLFREMLDGFALHEIICDDAGHPCDYRFLAINPAFEQMTGLKAADVIGHTVFEMMPDTEPHWIDVYGQVALHGEPVFFEEYSRVLGKHFEVTAFRPAPNQFATLFMDVTERKKMAQALEREQAAIRQLSRHVAELQEIERRRLARELHDEVGANLTAISAIFSLVAPKVQDDSDRMALVQSLLQETTRCVRGIIGELRPPVLDEFGLLEALNWYGRQIETQSELAVIVETAQEIPRLAAEVENALFRIAQESLTNIVKHAKASEVEITLALQTDHIRMVVRDDGVGFSLKASEKRRSPHWGLLNMTERAEALGGWCHIESKPRKGTSVIVEVPIAPSSVEHLAESGDSHGLSRHHHRHRR